MEVIKVPTEEKIEKVEELKSGKGIPGETIATSAEVVLTPRRIADTMMTLDEIRAIPVEDMPILIYCDGGSLFGWLIRAVDKSAASHVQILYDKGLIASQWFYFRTITVDDMKNYNAKLIWNPTWTPEQRKKMIDSIKARLVMGKWKTRYDVWGVVGEALNVEWLQSKVYDFCSEAWARALSLVDTDFVQWLKNCKTPTPREINIYTKTHNPPYAVYGRYMVDDDVTTTK